MTLVLSDRNIALVNSLRQGALKASIDFNVVKFFADVDYAKASLARFVGSGNAALVALADQANDSMFEPVIQARMAEVLPAVAAPAVGAALKAAPSFSPARYAAAKELMNGLVVDAAGLRSLLFVLKLESSSSLADLVALLPRFEKLVSKTVGPVAAHAMAAQIRKVL
jgi:hypothetical protein